MLITPNGKEKEVISKLFKIGFDNTLGYLKSSFESWKVSGRNFDIAQNIDANSFKTELKNNTLIFNIYKETLFILEHIQTATNTPLSNINRFFNSFPKNEAFFIHCTGGYRSLIAVSILKSRGVHNFIDVIGSFKLIKESEIITTNCI